MGQKDSKRLRIVRNDEDPFLPFAQYEQHPDDDSMVPALIITACFLFLVGALVGATVALCWQ